MFKSTTCANVVNYQNFFLHFQDENDNIVEKSKTLDEQNICCVKLVFIPSPTSNTKKKKVEIYFV